MMNWKRLLILIVAFILYLVIGALIFSALESAQEEETRVDLRQYKEAILANLTCLSQDQLEGLIQRIVQATNVGLNPLANVSGSPNWDFSSSFFFSGTVVTTIGYGHISPSSEGGQAFCIIYALIGIPMFGILMAAIGEKLKRRAELLEKRLGQRFTQHPKVKTTVYTIIVLASSILFFMVIPSAIFSHIEKWTFSEAFYYTFITLSTIGFGDFVIGTNPDINHHVLYKLGCFCWIIIGLSFLALLIAFISDFFTSTAEKIQQKHEEKKHKERGGVGEGTAKVEEGGQDGGAKTGEVKTGWKEDGDSEEMRQLKEKNGSSV